MIICMMGFSSIANAGWSDWFNKETVEELVSSDKVTKVSDLTLSSEKIVDGLKQALSKGADYAVETLGKTGGFSNDKNVKILMPEKLSKVEKLIRKTGHDKYADEFIGTMNSAAEKAVPLTIDILKDGIMSMSVKDAKNILNGEDDAATQYLRKVGSDRIKIKISDIVKQATAEAGVTQTYKSMYKKLGFAGEYLKLDDYDIDSYVTQKTMAGLFTMIAKEEKKIRDNPAERTTDILKEVFGSQGY